jgi:molybdate transport system substrate-binding protein
MPPADGDHGLVSLALLGAALASGCQKSPPPTVPLQVAAASDLSVAFAELGKLYESRTGQHVTFSFGASGMLAQQLSQGAPFDLFAAASASYVDSAVRAGACDGATKSLYARGHVVVWSKQGGARLSTLGDLTSPHIQHIAIANPDHAPYGKAAKEALVSAKLWPELEGKIVQAENVRQALQFAETGNADVALVALSLVARDESGQRLPIDPSLYHPIEQALVVCNHGKNLEGGREFAKLVESNEGQALLQRYGFAGSR